MTPATPAGPKVHGTIVARADTRPHWQQESDRLVRQIRAETDEFARYLLRLELLRVRYTPWKQRFAQKRRRRQSAA